MKKEFYTYAYLRENGVPYYIGKGKGNRAYGRHRKNIKVPKDESRILILKKDLTEAEAFKHEVYMIAVFGRKDLGTGVLVNMTNGGEGASGAVRSPGTRQRMSNSMLGLKRKPFSGEGRENMAKAKRGVPLTPEHAEAVRRAHRRGEEHPNYGKTWKNTEETKKRKSEAAKKAWEKRKLKSQQLGEHGD